MSGFFSSAPPAAPAPPPPPQRDDAEIRNRAREERLRRSKAQGRSSTILTSGQGVEGTTGAAATTVLLGKGG